MKKIEIIWRELLFQATNQKNRQFQQQQLAAKFGFSTSTVFQALKPLRKMGAVRVTGRFFILEDIEKVLYHWASVRNLTSDIIYQTRVDLTIAEIEGQIPPQAVFACYSAAKYILKIAPADYDSVYFYLPQANLSAAMQRFPLQKGRNNIFILKADSYLATYGQCTSLTHSFVDLWNLSDWYAKEFTTALKEKINDLLS